MTIYDIEQRIKHIEAIKDDDESAHGAEDELYAEFITYIKELDTPDPLLAAKATLILTTSDISFSRWCA